MISTGASPYPASPHCHLTLLPSLPSDGVWNRAEIEAIYGVHHVYSQKKSKDDVEHQKKADTIVETVLAKMDKNKDGEIALEEFVLVGLDGLPNFDNLGAEGHHYDVESGASSVWLCGRLLADVVC